MKNKSLIIGAVLTAFTFTSFATEPLLSPRAKGNQIIFAKDSPAATTTVVAHAQTTTVLLSPRAAGNQIKFARGTDVDGKRETICPKDATLNPRSTTECSSHAVTTEASAAPVP